MAADVSAAANLAELYRDLHRHPELSFQEERTAGILAARLRTLGFDTTSGVGGTGVVGVLRNGEGPTALLRADMDALPMQEKTDLPYASERRGVDHHGRDVDVCHACGHDVHVTCMVGAAAELAADRAAWSGTAVVAFQPAEELGRGAKAMVDDGLFDRFGRPDVVLGQHVAPLPAGFLALRPGPAFAGFDSLKVTLFGEGGHGSRPETTVDPVVMAAATVMRLQTVVSREVAATDSAVVTVGALRAGTKENIVPDEAELLISIRSFEPAVRDRVLRGVERVIRAEAAASGATRDPDIDVTDTFPPLVNDGPACARTRPALEAVVGPERVVDPGLVTGSEDVGLLATASGAPLVFWLLGGADPRAFAGAETVEELVRRVEEQPSNHSPFYAPVIDPTIGIGVATLVAAARTWMPA